MFSLKEANGMLPKVIEITEIAVRQLEKVKNTLEVEKLIDKSIAQENFHSESARILEKWASRIVELGIYPKGYFTVDFKSPIPDTLLCWTYGEKRIAHTHKTYESFKDRMPIQDSSHLGFEDSLN